MLYAFCLRIKFRNPNCCKIFKFVFHVFSWVSNTTIPKVFTNPNLGVETPISSSRMGSLLSIILICSSRWGTIVGLVAWWPTLERSQFVIWVCCSGKIVCFRGTFLLALEVLLLHLMWLNRCDTILKINKGNVRVDL